MNNIRFLILISLSLQSYVVSSKQDPMIYSLIHYNMREHRFTDDLGNEVKMNIFRSFDEDTREFKTIFDGRLRRSKGLERYGNRVNSYIRVLYQMGLQEELDITNLMEVFSEGQNSSVDLDFIMNGLKNFESISSGILDLSKFYANIPNLKYVKGSNEWRVFVNKIKHTGRHFRKFHGSYAHANNIPFKAFETSLEVLYYGMAAIDVANTIDLIFFKKSIQHAIQIDLALYRYAQLKRTAQIEDPAFWDALDRMIELTEALAGDDYWEIVKANIELNKKEVRDGIKTITEVTTSLFAKTQISYFSSLKGGLIGGLWLASFKFTANQFFYISDFEDDLRDAQTAMTIYKGFYDGLTGNDNISAIEHSIHEYAQFVFFERMYNAFTKNNYIAVLSWFNKDWKEVRITYRDDFNDIKDNITTARINRFLSSFSQSDETGDILISFIIDTSGSMGWNDPKNVRHSAMKMIIDRLQGHEHVFIVDFDNNAVWINDNHYKNWNREVLKSYVDRLGASGGTNIGLGMDVMQRVLEPRMGPESKVAVMLFTDGIGHFNNNDDWYTQNNIPVYTVGYEAEADASLMQRIATNTNGVFLLAQNEKEIANTFIQFLNALMNFNMIFNQSDAISQGQEIEYTFYVEENTSHLNASCSWLGSKIGLLLRAPGMRTFREHGQGNWFTGRNYTNFNLENPPAGEWTAILTGDNVPGDTEPFTFQVSGDTPAKFSLQNQIDNNGLIRLVLDGEGNIPDISQIKPTVKVRTPDNRQQDISDRFANGRLNYYPMSGEGGYQFEVSFNTSAPGGGRIQRHLMSSVFLGEYQPAYLGVIDQMLGNFITTGIGSHRGNRIGIKVEVFASGGDLSNPIATGYVTNVNADHCRIQIQYRTQQVKTGDIVRLDVTQWQMDDP